jgi:hypothetical protein
VLRIGFPASRTRGPRVQNNFFFFREFSRIAAKPLSLQRFLARLASDSRIREFPKFPLMKSVLRSIGRAWAAGKTGPTVDAVIMRLILRLTQ